MEPDCKMRHCNCYYQSTIRMCWKCKRNKNAERTDLTDEYISNRDKVDELFQYLMDNTIPEGIHVPSRPKLSVNKAWSLIWFLQEQTHCLPDNIEKCDRCGDLYDTDSEGYYLDDQYLLNGKTLPKKHWGYFCDGCVPSVDFELA